MAAAASVEVRVDEVQTLLAKLPETVLQNAKDAFRETTFAIHERILKRLQGNPLHSRTGNLGRSMLTSVSGTSLRTLSGRVYSTAIYAPIQELGGTVRAKNAYKWLPGGPYLNIPAPANLTPAGVQRMSSTEVFSAGGTVKKGAEGFGVYLGQAKMFGFAKEVKIPPRLGMIKSVSDEMPGLLSRLDDVLKGVE